MGIDTGFYQVRQEQPTTILDEAPKVANLAELGLQQQRIKLQTQKAAKDLQDQAAMQTAFTKNTDQQTGQLNRQGFLADLGKVAPMKALEAQKDFNDFDSKKADFQRKQLDDQINKMGLAYQMASSAKDQPSYDSMIGQMRNMGLDVSHMPQQFDPALMKRMSYMSLKQSERLAVQKLQYENQWKQQELAQKQQENEFKAQENEGKRNEKRTTMLKDDLDPNKARGGNMAKSQAMVNSAQRVDALFQQFPDGNIPKSQTVELANAVAALIGGGSAQSQQQINEITPHSLIGDSSAIASWLTNEPLGSDQKEFTKLLRETALREGALAQQQVRESQIQRLGAHDRLKQADPETYWAILHGYGIEPKDIKDGKYRAPNPEAERAKKIAGGAAPAAGNSNSVRMVTPDGRVVNVTRGPKVQEFLDKGGRMAKDGE